MRTPIYEFLVLEENEDIYVRALVIVFPRTASIEGDVDDTLGNWLDRRTCGFRVGSPLIDVTGFAVEPQHFEIGDAIRMSLDVRNASSVTVSGRCIFIVREAGKEVESLYNNFTSLAPGESLRFSSTWNSSSAKKGMIYYVTGYVFYESRTTSPMVAIISTNLFPVASFNYSPTKVGLGENVAFDASDSNDPDGNIASYRWSFGDGGEGFSANTTHAYYGLGSYEIVLNVTDNEGASSTSRQVLTIVKSYTLNVSSNVQVVIGGSGSYKEGDEVELSAPASVSMPGIVGLLGARYAFKEWIGELNSTEETVTLVFSGYRPMLEMRAVYAEDYTGAIIVASVAIVAVVAIAAISLRKRGRGRLPKPPEVPPPPPPTGEKAQG